MADVALGTKLFSRTDKLRNLLSSVTSDSIGRAYVAHDGEWNAEKESLFDSEFTTEVSLINLEYDAGVSVGKNSVADAVNEEFLLMVDSDHRIPENIDLLIRQLEARPNLGGIAGSIVEPERARIWQSGKNLYESGDGLIRDASGAIDIEFVADAPLVKFDFVPSAILLRVDCLEDYRWDESYVVGSEHLDFHVGHWKRTDWEFAISPQVLFEHYPGGDTAYMSARHGNNVHEGREYFRSKWGYEYVRDKQAYWYDTADTDLPTKLRRGVSQLVPEGAYKWGKRAYDTTERLVNEYSG